MEQLETAHDVAAATSEPMLIWAAQALEDDYPHEAGSAWRLDDAVVVYAPGLNRNDRLVFTGGPEAVAALLGRVPLPREGKLRALGTTESAREVAARGVTREVGTFGWMDLVGEPVRGWSAEWLPKPEIDEVAALLASANPSAYVVPGDPGARRWAGVRDASGALLSVAADCWPARELGFIGGVATHRRHRGRGLSRQVCGWLTERLYDEHGAVSLMVDRDNPAAIALYTRLGFTYRSVTAATVAAVERPA
ncbi:GNAT family N-acetyltransferase [Allosaccharopolyspora coralli]|nr:GNAT family N-acetyltransferase [Allosaccharopolyspora coralli]